MNDPEEEKKEEGQYQPSGLVEQDDS